MANPCGGCCAMCCPSPRDCVVKREGGAATAGSILAFLGVLDLAGSFLRMFILDYMSGFFFLINCWIIYISYATLNWCQITIVGVTAIIDVAQVGMMWSYITEFPEYKPYLIMFMIAAGIKLIASCFVYSLLKSAMKT
jgi:hypothetical protein